MFLVTPVPSRSTISLRPVPFALPVGLARIRSVCAPPVPSPDKLTATDVRELGVWDDKDGQKTARSLLPSSPFLLKLMSSRISSWMRPSGSWNDCWKRPGNKSPMATEYCGVLVASVSSLRVLVPFNQLGLQFLRPFALSDGYSPLYWSQINLY